MVEIKTPLVAALDTATPRPQAFVIPASTIRAFLAAQKLPPATGRDGLDNVKSSVVRVICVRK